ncbi:MAG: GLPGLI family protein [Bacteroidales bacterium]|nr:GLPGLI family protein [Bacteroidales bacterium]
MKYTFIVLILFCSFFSKITAQISSGKISYKIEKNLDNIKPTGENGYSDFQKVFFSVGEGLKFELKFNNKESLFTLFDELALDKNDFETEMTILILRGKSVFYSNLSDNVLIEQQDIFGETVRIKKTIKDLNWKFSNEKKQIGNYTCYKATGIKLGKNKNFQVTETKMTAWYCPELPYQFGPFEAVGLPGLVLEFGLGDFIWKAEEISFTELENKIQAPSSGILTTEKELEEMINKRIKN